MRYADNQNKGIVRMVLRCFRLSKIIEHGEERVAATLTQPNMAAPRAIFRLEPKEALGVLCTPFEMLLRVPQGFATSNQRAGNPAKTPQAQTGSQRQCRRRFA